MFSEVRDELQVLRGAVLLRWGSLWVDWTYEVRSVIENVKGERVTNLGRQQVQSWCEVASPGVHIGVVKQWSNIRSFLKTSPIGFYSMLDFATSLIVRSSTGIWAWTCSVTMSWAWRMFENVAWTACSPWSSAREQATRSTVPCCETSSPCSATCRYLRSEVSRLWFSVWGGGGVWRGLQTTVKNVFVNGACWQFILNVSRAQVVIKCLVFSWTGLVVEALTTEWLCWLKTVCNFVKKVTNRNRRRGQDWLYSLWAKLLCFALRPCKCQVAWRD